MQTHDSLGRRFPTTTLSTGKRVNLTHRRLAWFERLNWYGPLPSSFLLEYSRLWGYRNDQKARHDFTLLTTEDDTPYGSRYLSKPTQQNTSFYRPRNQQLVYDLSEASLKALKDADRYVDMGHNDHWMHRFGKACVVASIELGVLAAAKKGADVRFIPQHQALDRSPRIEVPYAYTDPKTGQTHHHKGLLCPDYVFAIEYGGKRRNFALEFTRATEINVTENFDRKSALRNTLQYTHLIGGKLYQELYGLNNLMLLNVNTNDTNMRNTMKVLHDVAKSPTNPEGKNNYMLFRSVKDFTRPFLPPRPLDLYAGAWERQGHEAFFINQ